VVRVGLGMPGDRAVQAAWVAQAGRVELAVSAVSAVSAVRVDLVASGAPADPRNGLRRPTAVHSET